MTGYGLPFTLVSMTTTPQLSPDEIRPLIQRLDDVAATLDELYTTTDGEVTPAAEAMEAFLDNEREVCLQSLAWWIRELQATEAACKLEQDRLRAVRERLARRVGFAQQTIRDLLGDMGVRKIDLGTMLISLRKGAQSVQRSEDAPEGIADLLEPRFQRVIPEKVEPDKKAIATALKAGEEVPFHTLVRGLDSVVIK